jgi:predicted nuclease of predicted toxin-antitoxin system
MKFIVDAHLPKSICQYFIDEGCQAIHTSDLPEGNHTSDADILVISIKEQAIVVSKDSNFYHTFLLHRKPPKLVVVKVGNMKLSALRQLFREQAPQLIGLLVNHDLVELYADKIIGID